MSGRDQDPYTAPLHGDEDDPDRPAGSLQLALEEKVPPVCLKCGGENAIVYHRQTFNWTPNERRTAMATAAMMTLALGVLGAAISRSRAAFKEPMDIPYCPRCLVREQQRKYLRIAGLLGAVLAVVLATRSWMPQRAVPVVLIAGFVGMGVALFIVWRRSLRPIHINERYIVLTGVATLAREKIDVFVPPKRFKAKRTKKKRAEDPQP